MDKSPAEIMLAQYKAGRRAAQKRLAAPRPCEQCGGVVDPKAGPITLIPWKCSTCTAAWRK